MSFEHVNDLPDPIEGVDHEAIGDKLRYRLFAAYGGVEKALNTELTIQQRQDRLLLKELIHSGRFIGSMCSEEADDAMHIANYFTAGCCTALRVLDTMAIDQSAESYRKEIYNVSMLYVPDCQGLDEATKRQVVCDYMLRISREAVKELPPAYKSLVDDIHDDEQLRSRYAEYLRLGFGFTYQIGIKALRETLFDTADQLADVEWDDLLGFIENQDE